MDAINPQRADSWRSLMWLVRGARWDFTCGFCRQRFRGITWILSSTIACPACGTQNILPVPGRHK